MALRYSKNLSIIASFLSTNLWCSAFLLSSEIGGLRNHNHDHKFNKHHFTTVGDSKEGVTERDIDNISPSSSSPPLSSLLSKRLDGLDAPTVWHEFSPLAVKHKSINLGQGFPDWDPPRFLIEELKRSTDPEYNDGITTTSTTTDTGMTANQYARSAAHLPLAEALRNDYVDYQWKESDLPTDKLHNLDAAANIATATGVTNVLYCALQGLVNPGDEVLLLEPYFDIYSSQVKLAGGTPIYCPLRSDVSKLYDQNVDNDESGGGGGRVGASEFFTLDLDELASKITTKTKVLILNTPHNPTGKIFNIDELEGIANLVSNYPNLIVLSDEVYQHLLFDKKKEPHISIATVNGGQIWDQTLTMSSAGKTFSCTGWKVGWAIGPAHLIKAITAVQQW
jgi:kynurenine--oxoglutarate transaminase/cysteine-S-conjugate beta-lyase/glutamine--phenylpyruvate transaminase